MIRAVLLGHIVAVCAQYEVGYWQDRRQLHPECGPVRSAEVVLVSDFSKYPELDVPLQNSAGINDFCALYSSVITSGCVDCSNGLLAGGQRSNPLIVFFSGLKGFAEFVPIIPPDTYLCVSRGGLAKVLEYDVSGNRAASETNLAGAKSYIGSNLSNPSPFGYLDRVNSGIGGPPVEIEAVDKCKGAKEGQGGLGDANPVSALSRLSREILRLKIIYFTLASFLLLPFGTLGLFWLFEYSDWKTRRRGFCLAGLLPLAFGILVYGLLF